MLCKVEAREDCPHHHHHFNLVTAIIIIITITIIIPIIITAITTHPAFLEQVQYLLHWGVHGLYGIPPPLVTQVCEMMMMMMMRMRMRMITH
jgi:hypothetical protein